MLRVCLVAVLIVIASTTVEARVNETEAQMQERFGEAVKSTVEHGFKCKEYEKNSFTIKVWFHESKAMRIEYVLRNAEEATIDALIKKNVEGKLIPATDPKSICPEVTSWSGRFFTSEDGEYVVNIYGSHARVMTSEYCSLLAEYQELEKRKQAEAKKLKEKQEAKLIESF